MIRNFRIEDMDQIMQLWLDTNIRAHQFIDSSYWNDNYEAVREMMPQATIYVYEKNEKILAFAGLMENYIAGIFVSGESQSQGIGKLLLNYCKETHSELSLNVYQKNERAVRFYLREDFSILQEKLDENTNEPEYLMEWKK